MSNSTLIAHAGARHVERAELAHMPCPKPTATWFPVPHHEVVDAVEESLLANGFRVRNAKFAVLRDARLFATMDLETPLATGVTVSVGIRNSTDKSLPQGFCAGSRVFVCDNLAFSAELMVKRKHTRFGQVRFREAIALAVSELKQFRENESRRIRRWQESDLNDDRADALILRAFERDVIGARELSKVIQEWREPSFEEFKPRTEWSLYNAITTAVGGRSKTNPQAHADMTMRLGALLDAHRNAVVA